MNLKIHFFFLAVVLSIALFLYQNPFEDKDIPSHIQKLQKLETESASFYFKDLQGQKYKMSDFKDRILILHFWATWCAPCIKELPLLNAFAKPLKDKLQVVAISTEDRETIQDFFKSFPDIDFEILIAQSSEDILYAQFPISGLPESYIFDKKMQLSRKIIGEQDWSHSSWKDYILDIFKKQ